MREEFEKVISASPFERDISRFPNDAEKYAWPGSYRDLTTDMAWEVWQEAWNLAVQKAAQTCEQRAYSHQGTQFLGPELNSLNCAIAINKMTLTVEHGGVGRSP